MNVKERNKRDDRRFLLSSRINRPMGGIKYEVRLYKHAPRLDPRPNSCKDNRPTNTNKRDDPPDFTDLWLDEKCDSL